MAFKMAIRSISGNKLRAVLTMLGIIIGVTALVVLVSLVNGATSSVTDAVTALGSDMVTVIVTDDKGEPLTLDELDGWVEEYDMISEAAPYLTDSATIKYDTTSDTATVYGVTSSYAPVEDQTALEGRLIKTTDLENDSWVAVLSHDAAEDLIGYTDCVGEQISLNGMKFTIVGVLAENDDSLMSMFTGSDMSVYIPYTVLPRLSTTTTDDVTTFIVTAPEGTSIDDTESLLESLLYERFDEDDDAYTISSIDALEEALDNITSILSILLGGIAAISLLVGGIGIMNIMLVTVTERTREIGIRKAIGASRGSILVQFLLEAIILCMMGCAAGIFLSFTLLRIVNVIVSSTSLSFSLNPTVVVIAVVFCFLIALIFGLYPANKAAKMKPIDALHYNG